MEFDFGPVASNWRYLALGLGMTMSLSLLTAIAATLFGTALALLRVYGPQPLKPAIAFYVDSIRAMPVLVVLVWTYFAFPLIAGLSLPPFWAALVALSLHASAYMSEIARAGITSVRSGQMRAGLALGMSRAAVIRRIILPQATVRILPSYGSMLAIIVKDSAVASVIAVPEYLYRSTTISAQTYRPIEVFTVAIVLYFLIIFPLTRGVDLIYRRVAKLGRS